MHVQVMGMIRQQFSEFSLASMALVFACLCDVTLAYLCNGQDVQLQKHECNVASDKLACGTLRPNDPNITLDITPKPLNVTCRLKRNFTREYCINSSQIYFDIWRDAKHQRISRRDIIILDKYRAQLLSSNVQLGDSSVRCMVRAGGKPVFIDSQHIEVGRVPYKPVNIGASIEDWGPMTITWDKEGINTHYKTYYIAWWKDLKHDGWSDWQKCEPVSHVDVYDEEYYASDSPDYIHEDSHCVVTDGVDAFDPRPIQIKVNVTNTVGANSSDVFNTSINELIIPAMLKTVEISQIHSTWVMLSWNSPRNMENFTYRINQTCQWDVAECSKSLLLNGDSMNRLTHNASDLFPFTLYNMSIESILVIDGTFWSEPFLFSFTTAEDVPTASPPVLPGSYYSPPPVGYDEREVTIFWKEVPAMKQNGIITHYTIKQLNEDNTLQTLPSTIPGDQFSHTIRGLSFDLGYSFFVFASTSVGRYETSNATIVTRSKHERSPPAYTLVAHEADELQVEWEPSSDLKAFVLYWCYRGNSHDDVCPGEINWKRFEQTSTDDNSANKGMVALDYGAIYTQYLFGVSAEFESTENTHTGIHWVDCIHDKNNKPGRPEELIFAETSDSVELKLEAESGCRHHPAVTSEYQLTYCVVRNGLDCDNAVAADMNIACEEEKLNTVLHVNVDSRYTLDHLDAEKTYLISAIATTREVDESSQSDQSVSIPKQFCVRTQAAAWHANKKHFIWITILCLILLFFLLVGLYIVCKTQQKCIKRTWPWQNMPLTLPGGEHEYHTRSTGRDPSNRRGNQQVAEVNPFLSPEIIGEDEDDKLKCIPLDLVDTRETVPNSGDSDAHRPLVPQLAPGGVPLTQSSESSLGHRQSGDSAQETLIVRLPDSSDGFLTSLGSDFTFGDVPSDAEKIEPYSRAAQSGNSSSDYPQTGSEYRQTNEELDFGATPPNPQEAYSDSSDGFDTSSGLMLYSRVKPNDNTPRPLKSSPNNLFGNRDPSHNPPSDSGRLNSILSGENGNGDSRNAAKNNFTSDTNSEGELDPYSKTKMDSGASNGSEPEIDPYSKTEMNCSPSNSDHEIDPYSNTKMSDNGAMALERNIADSVEDDGYAATHKEYDYQNFDEMPDEGVAHIPESSHVLLDGASAETSQSQNNDDPLNSGYMSDGYAKTYASLDFDEKPFQQEIAINIDDARDDIGEAKNGSGSDVRIVVDRSLVGDNRDVDDSVQDAPLRVNLEAPLVEMNDSSDNDDDGYGYARADFQH